MNLYFLKQNENNCYGTYESRVVCAESEDEARKIHPDPYEDDSEDGKWWEVDEYLRSDGWAKSPETVEVEFIGIAKEGLEKGVVCAHYSNA